MKTAISEKLGIRIRELRVANGLKQCDLADRLEMERSNLTRIESGKQRPSDENLQKIAEVLGVRLVDLFDFEHIQTKDELIKLITNSLVDMDEKELQFCYKFLCDLKQMR